MRKLLKIIMVIALVLSAGLARPGAVSAATGPFDCSSNFFYQVISGQLKVLDPLTGVYNDIGSSAPFDYNAIGYNVLDNYIYGIEYGGPQAGDLIRVANDGTTTDLGLPAGLPANGYINGSFDLAGNLYIRDDVHTLYKINVASMTATTLTISGDSIVAGADNVFINNNLYLLVGNNLSVVNLLTNSATTGTVTGPSGWLSAGNGFGAGWTDRAGELFFSNNGSGSIYQITDISSPTPTATFKVSGTVTANNDGASCSTALQNPFDPPIAANDTYATPLNTPLNQVSLPLLSNDLGNSLTVTSHTNPLHGTLSVNADGTFLYTPASNFSGTDSFDYTVTDAFGRTSSATVTITIGGAAVKAPDTGYGKPTAAVSAPYLYTLLATFTVILGLGWLYGQKRL